MSLLNELLANRDKPHVLALAEKAALDPSVFEELMSHYLGDESLPAQRAAWVFSHSVEKNPDSFIPYLKRILKQIEKDTHPSIKRTAMRAFSQIDVPKNLWGKTIDIGFKFMNNSQEPIAVKVFTMTVLYNIIQHVPELKKELQMVIEDQMVYGSPGFKSRGSKILRQLSTMKE